MGRARIVLKTVEVCLFVVGSALVLTVFWQAFNVYLTFSPVPNVESGGDVTRYNWTAAACLGCVIAALVLAIVLGHKWAIAFGCVLVLVALAVVFVFAVPHGRWTPDPEPRPLPTNYQPCYSGSNDCVEG